MPLSATRRRSRFAFLRFSAVKVARKASNDSYPWLYQWNWQSRRRINPADSKRSAVSSAGNSTCQDDRRSFSAYAIAVLIKASVAVLTSALGWTRRRGPRTGVKGTADSNFG